MAVLHALLLMDASGLALLAIMLLLLAPIMVAQILLPNATQVGLLFLLPHILLTQQLAITTPALLALPLMDVFGLALRAISPQPPATI